MFSEKLIIFQLWYPKYTIQKLFKTNVLNHVGCWITLLRQYDTDWILINLLIIKYLGISNYLNEISIVNEDFSTIYWVITVIQVELFQAILNSIYSIFLLFNFWFLFSTRSWRLNWLRALIVSKFLYFITDGRSSILKLISGIIWLIKLLIALGV